MARKSKPVTITAEGRDNGKVFIVTEMAASRAEAWAIRALGAMSRGGVDIPLEMVESGMAGMAAVGLRALMAAPFDDLQPLLAEMMSCVAIVMPAAPQGRPIIDDGFGDDIEEMSTRIRLRDEVFELHAGFSIATVLLTAVAQSLTQGSEDTQISAAPSEPSSPGV